MSTKEDFYAVLDDPATEISPWIDTLHRSHLQRSLAHKQINRFYFRRNLVEYSVKTTITASMTIALIWGGPPAWIIGGAALILKLSSYLLNRFNPSQYIEGATYEADLLPATRLEKEKLEQFRSQWKQSSKNYFFKKQEEQQRFLQQRIACALVIGFVIFTLLNASLTVPVIVASLLYALALIDKAQEIPPPYLEEKEALDNLYVFN